MALDARPSTTASTDAARQAMTCRWYSFQTLNWFQEHMVCKHNLWDPQRTSYMSPPAIIGLLECAPTVWTQTAIDRARW